MARGRSSGRGSRVVSTPSFSTLTRDALSIPLPSGHLQVPGFGRPLHLVEDGRVWHPDPDHGAMTVGGRWARVVVHQRPLIARSKAFAPLGFGGMPVGLQVPWGVQFHSPFKVVTCVRRKVRRAVMFAKNKAGSGKKRQRMPRRTWRSEVWC